MRAVTCTHLEDGTPSPSPGVGGYFGGAGEVIVWNLRTGRMRQTPGGRTLLRFARCVVSSA
jgi:hypothetical protein